MLVETAYRKYSAQMVQSMTRFSRDETTAKDAVSQAFTQALIHRPMLEEMPEPAMKAWLYAAARNAIIDLKRKEARTVSFDESAQEESFASSPENRILIESMLGRLPQELLLPVYLKYYQGYNSTEIGKAMGIPSSTIRTRLRVALNLMRQMMKGDL